MECLGCLFWTFLNKLEKVINFLGDNVRTLPFWRQFMIYTGLCGWVMQPYWLPYCKKSFPRLCIIVSLLVFCFSLLGFFLLFHMPNSYEFAFLAHIHSRMCSCYRWLVPVFVWSRLHTGASQEKRKKSHPDPLILRSSRKMFVDDVDNLYPIEPDINDTTGTARSALNFDLNP